MVDPRIGSVGVGRTFPGPSMPFGMVKPGPDCSVLPNAGWASMPTKVTGFSQTHVSGTGGGQKYGNVLIQPFLIDAGQTNFPQVKADGTNGIEQLRRSEDFALGYYSTTYESGITTRITTAERCSFYQIETPDNSQLGLLLDASHFLGKDSIPNLRERQQFVDACIDVCGEHEVTGFTAVRGGWNNGDTYRVFFCMQTDQPFSCKADGSRQWGVLQFADAEQVNIKIGISYVSTEQARLNIPQHDFQTQLKLLREAWQQQLDKIVVHGTEQQKRMFYTALYHTLLMPVDKTGEYPRKELTDKMKPYYDDYYAIWDTYRTSTPLITLLDLERQRDIVNSLLNIYEAEGYMPDARSGDCNGRTQGGSNAEVVVADAFVKGLDGIDYEKALQAMLNDAEVPPADHEREGRGGLEQYLRLGYIPYGTDRAGTRTIEYAYDDYCIAEVAKGLGHKKLSRRYMKQSRNWRNLWRKDYEWDGMCGFIMPKDENGEWLDSVPWGHSRVFHPTLPYTPVTKVAPWHIAWWSTFFYEALSEEYSLSIPHDIKGLMKMCGGRKAFRQRLDNFFEKNYYNVANEPSFLTPCYYHWTGQPEKSSRRIHHIIRNNYSDAPDGLPGNDDSGAMSSWLAFHMMGLYPNAGQPYYLLNVPLVDECTIHLSNGRSLHISKQGEGDGFKSVSLNGRRLRKARITHQQLMQGGELVFSTHPEQPALPVQPVLPEKPENPALPENPFAQVSFTLNRQFRTWPLSASWDGDTLQLVCKQTIYRIPRAQVQQADSFCWLNPQLDGTVHHNVQGTFLFISQDALQKLLKEKMFVYDGIIWRQVGRDGDTIHVQADIDLTEMWIRLPQQADAIAWVVEMKNNPLGIDWKTDFTTPLPKP